MLKKLFSTILATVLCATVFLSVGCSRNGEQSSNPPSTETGADDVLNSSTGDDLSADIPYTATLTSATNNTTVNLLSGNVYEFATNYSINVDWPNSMDYANGQTQYEPTPAHITWADSEAANYYTVKIGRKSDLSDAQTFATFTNSLDVEDLFMGTEYYYQIIAHRATRTVKSNVFTFTTAHLPRTISLPATYRDTNCRDIGGYYTEDGNYRIKQGVAYRSAEVQHCTAEAKNKLLYKMGIKTELALHSATTPDLGDAVNFITVESPHYVNYGGIHYAFAAQHLATALLTFADANNYPILFHCQLGRDRTGTLAFLLGALCGVGQQDLFLDFEMAYFSNYGSIGWDGNGTPKAKTGQFERMFRYINEGVSEQDNEHDDYGDPVSQSTITNPYFKTTDTTLAERTATYLKGFLGEYGINDDVIAAIRANLLEEV